MRSQAIVPHIALPVKLGPTGISIIEQDTIAEIAQCVQVLLSTRLGSRLELPDYGVPDPTFRTDIDETTILSAINEWEPRALAAALQSIDSLDDLLRHLEIDVSSGEAS